jgi:hypothetical protein
MSGKSASAPEVTPDAATPVVPDTVTKPCLRLESKSRPEEKIPKFFRRNRLRFNFFFLRRRRRLLPGRFFILCCVRREPSIMLSNTLVLSVDIR